MRKRGKNEKETYLPIVRNKEKICCTITITMGSFLVMFNHHRNGSAIVIEHVFVQSTITMPTLEKSQCRSGNEQHMAQFAYGTAGCDDSTDCTNPTGSNNWII